MHVKGFDMAWHILLQLQQTILWPLPLVWWVSRSHSFARERVCDESASALTKNREAYRSDLAKLALAVLNSNHQPFLLSMVKRPEINRRLLLLALRPPILHVGLRLKTAFSATILLAVLTRRYWLIGIQIG
jgi:beta-lactamase regulating signal transducer with metallopeptidase domain